MMFKSDSGHLYVQKTCEDCGHEYLHRTDVEGSCPVCRKVKRRSRPDLTDPNIKRTYQSYYAMLSRCLNTGHKDYPNYGGRGVCVCPEWVESFDTFIADVGVRPPNTSLDRISPNKHYTKDNVRWANQSTQNKNKRHRYEGLWSKVLKPQAEKFKSE